MKNFILTIGLMAEHYGQEATEQDNAVAYLRSVARMLGMIDGGSDGDTETWVMPGSDDASVDVGEMAFECWCQDGVSGTAAALKIMGDEAWQCDHCGGVYDDNQGYAEVGIQYWCEQCAEAAGIALTRTT